MSAERRSGAAPTIRQACQTAARNGGDAPVVSRPSVYLLPQSVGEGSAPCAKAMTRMFCSASTGDASAEAFAGGDAELGEHVAQVPLDGAGADEQLGGDLLVGLPVPGQPGDLDFLGREVGEGLGRALAHGFPGGQQLAAGPFREAFHTYRGQDLVR